MLNLASGFVALGYEVDLLVCEMRGELCDSIPGGVNLIVLEPTGLLVGLWAVLTSHRGGAGKILSYIASNHKIPRSFRFIRPISGASCTFFSVSGLILRIVDCSPDRLGIALAGSREKAR
jgi:hypothetical protein